MLVSPLANTPGGYSGPIEFETPPHVLVCGFNPLRAT